MTAALTGLPYGWRYSGILSDIGIFRPLGRNFKKISASVVSVSNPGAGESVEGCFSRQNFTPLF